MHLPLRERDHRGVKRVHYVWRLGQPGIVLAHLIRLFFINVLYVAMTTSSDFECLFPHRMWNTVNQGKLIGDVDIVLNFANGIGRLFGDFL